MKVCVSILVMLSMLSTLVSGIGVYAQSPSNPFAQGYQYYEKPPGAVLGASTEAQNAVNSLSEKQRQSFQEQLEGIINQVRQNDPGQDNSPVTESLAFKLSDGSISLTLSSRSSIDSNQFEFEAPAAQGNPSTCSRSIEQFIRLVYLTLLNREPLASELFPAETALAQAQSQGPAQFLTAAQAFTGGIFTSGEYIAIGKTDSQFVVDLFAIYRDIVPSASSISYQVTRVQHYGRDHVRTVTFEASPLFENDVLAPMCSAATFDADLDGLPDYFENRVANSFTPYYYVSGGETDNFATFNNSIPQTVNQTLGQTPFSYFRVQPLGFARNQNNQLFSVLRVDYLTLWDHDSGLVSGGLCAWNLFGLDDIIASLSSHSLDNERAAALVAAPVQTYSYNTNPAAYHAYDYFTAAHENTLTDQSRYHRPASPVPAGGHILLGLTRSKHATYTANVNGLPLTPSWIIMGTLNTIDFLYLNGEIDYYTYLILLALAYDVFYSCITESFSDQGGQFSNRRQNVGEPQRPINNSGFILAPELNNKLSIPLWN